MIKFQKETAVKYFFKIRKWTKFQLKSAVKLFLENKIMKFQIETAVKSFVRKENERI